MAERTPEFLAHFSKGYGRYIRSAPDYDRCAKPVYDGIYNSQCSRKNGHGRHGAWCKQHDPDARAARLKAEQDAYLAARNEADRKAEFIEECQSAVRDIAEGRESDPVARCKNVMSLWGMM